MEYTQWVGSQSCSHEQGVLILVVMEYTQWGPMDKRIIIIEPES